MASLAESLVRGAYDALNEDRIALWARANAPEHFELIVPPGAPQAAERFEGPQGLERFAADLAQVWEAAHIEVNEVVDMGTRIVVIGRIHNRGRHSGVQLDSVLAHLWTVDGDVPVRCELIGDREEALRRGRAESSD